MMTAKAISYFAFVAIALFFGVVVPTTNGFANPAANTAIRMAPAITMELAFQPKKSASSSSADVDPAGVTGSSSPSYTVTKLDISPKSTALNQRPALQRKTIASVVRNGVMDLLVRSYDVDRAQYLGPV
jgi:hypothetical protein